MGQVIAGLEVNFEAQILLISDTAGVEKKGVIQPGLGSRLGPTRGKQ